MYLVLFGYISVMMPRTYSPAALSSDSSKVTIGQPCLNSRQLEFLRERNWMLDGSSGWSRNPSTSIWGRV